MTQRASYGRRRVRPAVAACAAIAAIASVGVTGAGPAIAAGSACDVATAQAVVNPTDNPQMFVNSVDCDAFLGPSRPAMLALIRPQCGCDYNVGGWEVLGLVDGAWVPAVDRVQFPTNLTVSGATIIEMRTIRRRDDWGVFSGRTGGTQTRTWAWDGAAGMAATPWQYVTPPQAPGVVLWLPRVPDPVNGVPPVALFQVGNRIVCAIDDASLARVRCTHVGNAPAVTATFGPGRPVRICRSATRKCALAEIPSDEQSPNVLHARQSVIVGRFTCRAGPGASAVRCTLASGRGFTLGGRGARRLA